MLTKLFIEYDVGTSNTGHYKFKLITFTKPFSEKMGTNRKSVVLMTIQEAQGP